MRRIACSATIAAVLFASQAGATGSSVARLVDIRGNVLVTTQTTIASAGERLRLAPGMRVLVTLNSAATVEFDGGCRVKLAAGERLEIGPHRPCQARPNSVTPAVAPVLGSRP